MRTLQQVGISAVLFLLLDLVWLTLVADGLYARLLGDLLADQPNTAAAAAFYVLFLLGLVHFVIGPAVARDSISLAARSGALFGLVTYATWDLTSLAVLEGFPAALVPIDLAWGSFLACAVSTGTVAVCRALSRRRRPARP